ncbi:MAG: hypothetical protein QM755_13595 [Luteolibacter sp.]
MTPKPESRMPAGTPNPPWRIAAASSLVVGLFHLLRWMPRRWMYGGVTRKLGTLIRGHLREQTLDHAARVVGDSVVAEGGAHFGNRTWIISDAACWSRSI